MMTSLLLLSLLSAHAETPDPPLEDTTDARVVTPQPPCTMPSTLDDLGEVLSANELAWSALDAQALRDTSNDARAVLGCLKEPLLPADAASYFRAHAYSSFVSGDLEATNLYFQAASEILPGYVLPGSIVGENHPLRKLYEAAKEHPPSPLAPLPRPNTGWSHVDGKRATEAPNERPWVFQRFGDQGSVLATQAMAADQLPDYPLYIPPAAVTDGKRTSRGLLTAGLVSGVIAGASMTTAGLLRGKYNGTAPEEGELTGLIRTNHVLGYGGIGVGAVAAGLTVGAVAVHRW